MPIAPGDRTVVERMFKAMQAGADGVEAMMALFAADAVLVEPFSGEAQTHAGKPAIRRAYEAMNAEPDPDLTLVMDRLDLDGDRLRADWTCTSPHFPTAMRGFDLLTIRDGKIARLEIIVTDMPAMPGQG